MPSVVMMAGGTGGHIFPALAVADELKKQGVTIDWLGTDKGLEASLVPEHGYPLHCIDIQGLRGKGIRSLLTAPWRIVKAILQARKVLKQINPDAVVGMGGYATGPGGVAAKWLGVPLLIHEQNAIAGMTNRWLSRIANVSMQAFEGAIQGAVTTGNPVRSTIVAGEPGDAHQTLRVLVVGGSLGAKAINDCVIETMQRLPESQRPELWHQTGKAHFDELKARYDALGITANVEAFVSDMASAYAWADLVICRAGALTVSEIARAGKAALFVPFPWAVDDHQTHNANFLVQHQAANLCQQTELTPAWLEDYWLRASQNRVQLQDMAEKAKQLAKPHATLDVVEQIKRAIHD